MKRGQDADEAARNAASLNEIMKSPPYTPRASWPKSEQSVVKAYKTRFHRGTMPLATFVPKPTTEDAEEDVGDSMLRAMRAAT